MKFRSQGARRRIHLLLVAEHLPRQFITMKYATSITCATLLAVAAAAPVSHTRPILPRTEEASDNNVVDVLPSGLTDLTTAITDALPLDVSVSAPVLPEDRHAARAISVDLGGAGATLRRAPAEDSPEARAISVDLGGAGATL
jgi:hypothetical protein